MQDLDSERRKLTMVQRQLRDVEGSSSAAAVQAGEVAALRETVAALTADLKVLLSCPELICQCTHACTALSIKLPDSAVSQLLHCRLLDSPILLIRERACKPLSVGSQMAVKMLMECDHVHFLMWPPTSGIGALAGVTVQRWP